MRLRPGTAACHATHLVRPAQAALASGLVDVVLVPEVSWRRVAEGGGEVTSNTRRSRVANAAGARLPRSSSVISLLCGVQVPFSLERVVGYMERLLDSRGHIVVCMAEGAGQVGPR